MFPKKLRIAVIVRRPDSPIVVGAVGSFPGKVPTGESALGLHLGGGFAGAAIGGGYSTCLRIPIAAVYSCTVIAA